MPANAINRIGLRAGFQYLTAQQVKDGSDLVQHYFEQMRLRRALHAAAKGKNSYLGQKKIDEDFVSQLLTNDWVVSAGVALLDGESNGVVSMLTTATGTNLQFMDIGGRTFCDKTQNPQFGLRMKLMQTTQLRVRAGIKIGQASAEATTNYVLIENDVTTTAANWFGVMDNAGTRSTVDLSTSVDTANYQNFLIKIDGTNNVVEFIVNGIFQGAIAATLTSSKFSPHVSILEKTASARELRVDRYTLWWNET